MIVKDISLDDQVDLHLHSTASDGTWSPEELINQVTKAGIRVISLTDHDTIANVAETSEKAKKKGILCVPGVEVNSSWTGRCFHILGYCINIEDNDLQSLLNYNVKLLRDSDRYAVELVADRVGKVSVEDYEVYTHDPTRGGWKALNYLVDKGICKDGNDFFKQFPNSLDVEFFPPQRVINAIKGAGGYAVFAHPGSSYHKRSDFETLEGVLNLMMDFGIDGVECYHFSHSHQVTEFCLDWCKTHNLLITGGSDCHGDYADRKLGLPRITARQVDLFNLLDDKNS